MWTAHGSPSNANSASAIRAETCGATVRDGSRVKASSRAAAGAASGVCGNTASAPMNSASQAMPPRKRLCAPSHRRSAGATGAIVADLMMQIFGIGATLVIGLPVIWALRLIRGNGVDHIWKRGWFAVGGIVLFCAALGCIEPPATWPLQPGT